MRISTTQFYLQGLQAFGNQQVKLAKLQEQISTGVRIANPSDDPAGAARVLELEQEIKLHEQYQTNITLANQRLSLQDSTLQGAENLLQRVRELAIHANNASLDQVSRDAIADELDQRRQELLSLANTVDSNGDFLFAGFQNQQRPFVFDKTGSVDHVRFNGDEGERWIQISSSRQINTDTSGRGLFMEVRSNAALNERANAANTGSGVIAPARVFDNSLYVPGDYEIVFTGPNTYDVVDVATATNIVTGAAYSDSQPIEFQGIRTSITGAPAAGDRFRVSQGQYQDMFEIISNLSDTLRSSSTDAQRSANYAQALVDLDSAYENLLAGRTGIGGRMNALDAQKDDNEAFIVTTTQTVGEIRDTDLAEAISQLTLEQTTLDAAQAVFARITSSSLFNFLR